MNEPLPLGKFDRDLDALVADLLPLVKPGNARAVIEWTRGVPPGIPGMFAQAMAWWLAGNCARARAVLEAMGSPPASLRSGYDQLRASLDPGFESEQTQLDSRAAANLALLERDQPDLAARMRGASPGRWTWASDEAQFHFVELGPDGPRFLEEACGDAEVRDLQSALRELVSRKDRALMFGALKYGRLLRKAVELHPEGLLPGQLLPYFVLEPSAELFALHLRFADFAEYLAKGNVRFFVGDDAVEQLGAFLCRSPFSCFPGSAIHLDSPEVVRRLEALTAQAEIVREPYRGPAPATLRARFDPGAREPLRVLCLTCLFSSVVRHSAYSAAAAFEELGCRSQVLMEDSPIGRMSGRAIRGALAAFRPDLIFAIDHLRDELAGLVPATVPYVCWIQDPMPHLFDPALAGKTTDLDFVFVVSPDFLPLCREAGYRDVRRLPMAFDARTYVPPDRADPALACDLSFASNVTAPAEAPGRPGLLAHVLGQLEGKPFRFTGPGTYAALLERAEREMGLRLTEDERRTLASSVCAPAVRYARRVPPLRWAKDEGWNVKLFGRGWETFPDLRDLAHGTIESGARLRDLYASARITLHVNEGLNLHQRVFECIASGGFVLARELPSDREPGQLAEHLEIGREIVTFGEREDFVRTVRHYLSNETERRKIIQAGRARVLAEHTYVRRMESVLKDVRERLAR